MIANPASGMLAEVQVHLRAVLAIKKYSRLGLILYVCLM